MSVEHVIQEALADFLPTFYTIKTLVKKFN